MGDSNNKEKKEGFDFETELSTLVKNNFLNPKIAEKLKTKLKQKNVNLTKNQFHMLVNKINEIMKNYKGIDKTKNKPVKTTEKSIPKDDHMQKLVESIESLEERLTDLEENLSITDTENEPTKFVRTEDIQVNENINIPTSELHLEPLTKVPNNPESVIVLMKWLQYLIDKCGRDNLSNILDYYVDIGWISEDAKISLVDYSHGITEDAKKSDNSKNISDLPSKDHIQSLVFIQKLKGNQFDKHFIDKIDSELSRITKKLDKYNLK